MGFKKLLALKALHHYSKSGKGFPAKKLKKFAIIGLIVGFIGFLITIVLVVLVVRWAWNVGSDTVQNNPTVSSVVETTKQQATDLLPTVPSAANDFIQNGQVDTAKLTETYTNLPTQTQQVWKNAMETSINEAIQSATPAEVVLLRQLLADLGQL